MEYVGTDDQRRSTFYSRVIREGYCDNYDLPRLKVVVETIIFIFPDFPEASL